MLTLLAKSLRMSKLADVMLLREITTTTRDDCRRICTLSVYPSKVCMSPEVLKRGRAVCDAQLVLPSGYDLTRIFGARKAPAGKD